MLRYTALVGEREQEVTVRALDDGRWEVTVGGRAAVWDARWIAGGVLSLLGAGRAVTAEVDGALPDVTVHVGDRSMSFQLLDARQRLLLRAAGGRAGAGRSGPEEIRAPMPGKVVKVLVKPGDLVKTGQGL